MQPTLIHHITYGKLIFIEKKRPRVKSTIGNLERKA